MTTTNVEQTKLRQYVREVIKKTDTKLVLGKTIGLLMASREENMIIISWSKCRTTGPDWRRDHFSKATAVRIAEGRLATGTNAVVPNVIFERLGEFMDRCRKYYKLDHVRVLGYCEPDQEDAFIDYV